MSTLLLPARFIVDLEKYISQKLNIKSELQPTLTDLENMLLKRCQSAFLEPTSADAQRESSTTEEQAVWQARAATEEEAISKILSQKMQFSEMREEVVLLKKLASDINSTITELVNQTQDEGALLAQIENLETEAQVIDVETPADEVEHLSSEITRLQTDLKEIQTHLQELSDTRENLQEQLVIQSEQYLEKYKAKIGASSLVDDIGEISTASLDKHIHELSAAIKIYEDQLDEHHQERLKAQFSIKQSVPLQSGPAKHAAHADENPHHQTNLVCGKTLKAFLASNVEQAVSMIGDMSAIDTSVLKSLCALWYIYQLKNLSRHIDEMLQSDPRLDLEKLMFNQLAILRRATQRLSDVARGPARQGTLETLIQKQSQLSEACSRFYEEVPKRPQYADDAARVNALLRNCNEARLTIDDTDNFHQRVMKITRSHMLEYIQSNLSSRNDPEPLVRTVAKKAVAAASVLTAFMNARAVAEQPSDMKTSDDKIFAAVTFLVAIDKLGQTTDPRTYASLLFSEFSRMCTTVKRLPSYQAVRTVASYMHCDVSDRLDKAFQSTRDGVTRLQGFEPDGLDWGALTTPYELPHEAATPTASGTTAAHRASANA